MDSRILIGVLAVIAVIGGIVFLGASDPEVTTDPARTNDQAAADPTQPDSDPATTPPPEPPPAEEPPEEVDGNSIVDVASDTDELSTLVTAITEAGIGDILDTDGPFTVLAPSDTAFEALPEGTLDTMLQPENNEQLQNVLASHVLLGVTETNDLEDGMTVTTLNEQELTVTIADDGSVMIGESTVTEADVEADNGVIHIIDTVIEDPS